MFVQTVIECDCCGARSDPMPDDHDSWNSYEPAGWFVSNNDLSWRLEIRTPTTLRTVTHLCPMCSGQAIYDIVR